MQDYFEIDREQLNIEVKNRLFLEACYKRLVNLQGAVDVIFYYFVLLKWGYCLKNLEENADIMFHPFKM